MNIVESVHLVYYNWIKSCVQYTQIYDNKKKQQPLTLSFYNSSILNENINYHTCFVFFFFFLVTQFDFRI